MSVIKRKKSLPAGVERRRFIGDVTITMHRLSGHGYAIIAARPQGRVFVCHVYEAPSAYLTFDDLVAAAQLDALPEDLTTIKPPKP